MSSLLSSNLPSRVHRLREALREAGINVFIATKPETIHWVSRFNPIIQSMPAVVLVYCTGDPTLLVNAIREPRAREKSFLKDIRAYGNWFGRPSIAPDWNSALKKVLDERGLVNGKIAIEEEGISAGDLRRLTSLLSDASFSDISTRLQELRRIKDDDEIVDISKAAILADIGVAAGVKAVQEQQSELVAVGAARAAMNSYRVEHFPEIDVCGFGSRESGQHNALGCWVLAGDRVHHRTDSPTTKVAQNGEMASVLVWANCNGYYAEKEASVCIGEVRPTTEKALEAIRAATDACLARLAPGTPVKEIYAAACDVFVKYGFGAHLPSRVGHGIGLGSHEAMSINASSGLMIEKNMTITIEPNLSIPDGPGTQFSNTIAITETKYRHLTKPVEFMAPHKPLAAVETSAVRRICEDSHGI
ncbi:Xaa-Pro aminopeptidase [Aspergillus sergii]|uniref:Probable Xaa-Pro aminopeptidase P n=1 Tax=Aspergillus sergii TaxID=1034303 RepID=A0A5N6WZC8_9EURO|nr:Xaa-Pro aminopeptidase [Aspergillus sergii]